MSKNKYPKSNEALLLEYLIQQYKEEFFSILNTIFILDEPDLSMHKLSLKSKHVFFSELV